MPKDTEQIEAIALLEEPIRRALYDHVAVEGRWVGRDEAAGAVGISRALAAFHLDRLARDGLLDVEYRRISGRSGPGAGRPAKLYRRSDREVSVSLPARRYEVPARLFATALEQLGAETPPGPLRAAASEEGETVGLAARRRAGARPSPGRLREALVETLDERGYEPRVDRAGEIRFGNCPFHGLVEDHRDLVCGMNLSLAEGMLDGLGDERLCARLDPQPGLCCVAIRPSAAPEDPPAAA